MSDSLKQTITSSMKEAMKAKEKDRLGVIRLIQAAIKQKEVDERIELKDADVLVVLDKMLKQRRESIKQFKEANRDDLVQKESFEVDIIQAFLPKPLTEQEVVDLIQNAIKETNAQSVKDMGKVMGIVRPAVQGRGDMGEVSKKIKDFLITSSS